MVITKANGDSHGPFKFVLVVQFFQNVFRPDHSAYVTACLMRQGISLLALESSFINLCVISEFSSL